jgi:AcrR family transcriptional regulator
MAGRLVSPPLDPKIMTRSARNARTAPTAEAAGPSLHQRHGEDSASAWRAGRKRLRDHGVKRDAVVRAAARAFAGRGFHNTSLDDIAKALDVTKPTIYYYVTNKEELLFQCFVTGLEPIRAALRAVKTAKASGRERLNTVLRQYAQAVASDFGWCMVIAEHQDLSPSMSEHIRQLKVEIDQGIRRLLREGVKDGSIQACDAKMTAVALAGALNWIAHWYRANHSMSASQVADAFVTIFEEGLRPRAPARRRHSTRVTARARGAANRGTATAKQR